VYYVISSAKYRKLHFANWGKRSQPTALVPAPICGKNFDVRVKPFYHIPTCTVSVAVGSWRQLRCKKLEQPTAIVSAWSLRWGSRDIRSATRTAAESSAKDFANKPRDGKWRCQLMMILRNDWFQYDATYRRLISLSPLDSSLTIELKFRVTADLRHDAGWLSVGLPLNTGHSPKNGELGVGRNWGGDRKPVNRD